MGAVGADCEGGGTRRKDGRLQPGTQPYFVPIVFYMVTVINISAPVSSM